MAQELFDVRAGRDRRLSAEPGDGNRRGGVGERGGPGQGLTLDQSGGQRAAERIAGGRGIHRLHGERRDVRHRGLVGRHVGPLCSERDHDDPRALRTEGECRVAGAGELREMTAIVDGIRSGVSQAELAAQFHASFVMMLADGAEEVARARGLDLIALSGGTFNNRIVLESLMDELERRELRAIMHLSTPPGDGCVALGQAAVAQARWQ